MPMSEPSPCFRWIRTWVSLIFSAWPKVPAYAGYGFGMNVLSDQTTSSAVTGSPLCHLTPGRRVKSNVLPPSVYVNDVASCGTHWGLSLLSRPYKLSQALQ
jgi:hypothetical protein